MQFAYNNKFKPTKNDFQSKLKKNLGKISFIITLVFVFLLIIYKTTLSYSSNSIKSIYPKYHSFYKNDIPTKSSLIFPSVEHAPLLRELTIDKLFNTQLDQAGNKKYLFSDSFDDETTKQKNEEDSSNQMLKVKNSFLNHGKLKFNGPETPEIIIVTGIDFEKYELSHLTKIVQNRVNYSQKKGYGLYINWIQQYTPLLKDTGSSKEWAKLFLLRSAQYAFPNAKYFWYLDEDALIMRYDIDLYKYLLDPKVLDPIMLRNQPIIPPNGVIHTFKNTKAENVQLIITQSSSDLNLNSFIIKNEFISKSLLEFWSDTLFRTYHNFPKNGESALTHILQWHPIYLARTAIIPPRTIAGLHTQMELPEGGDEFHYSEGDFVVSLRDCSIRKSCESEIDLYWSKLEGK
ncbi:putative alpha-1,6-mannosyltransferase MNN11 [Wickerhamomyces ciferrii]|uniref:Alpha-1,6-mannosyltransferase MNN11 n=1 Tax=Wickerhamomyces ciferrii (strain ATCC 14091 / BCRC 22168 / CBS 111 / JCM 3599 / NBRC 0793 / NRRL Y-1031 F-60-10) TaxID=1206466 RepID=K0KJ30_WICCF|nr:putative alpha-1,6-mannosyltransferase MNN11 [Wickerhamomyces ciferrii]CCH42976.1 putative alpha-1,6-mannosyltransferase MNN11 [Wickerhamomyces ciferrii]